MEKVCEQCGSLVSGNVKFCPVCGAYMPGAVDLGKPDVQSDIMPNGGQTYDYTGRDTGYSPPQYGQNINNIAPSAQQQQSMSTGEWFVTIFLCSALGIVSVILNIVWGVDMKTSEPKRSFCRAMLIFNILSSILGIILLVFMFGVFGSGFISAMESW